MKNLLTNSKKTDCIPHIDTHAQYMNSSTYDLQWSFPSPLGGSVAQHINWQTSRSQTDAGVNEAQAFLSLCNQTINKEAQNEGTVHKVKVKHQGENNRSGTVQSLKTDERREGIQKEGLPQGQKLTRNQKIISVLRFTDRYM